MSNTVLVTGASKGIGQAIDDFSLPEHYTRKRVRSMGRVAQFSTVTTERALESAGLLGDPVVSNGDTGIAYGSSSGTPDAIAVFGANMPFSSMKSYFGHTLGACGAQEVWLTLEMMNRDEFWPTLNLENLDPRCGELDYITGGPRKISTEYVVSNSFAFGGINTSLVFKRRG